jgi:hypothetical protein
MSHEKIILLADSMIVLTARDAEVQMNHAPQPLGVADHQRLIETELRLELMNHFGRDGGIEFQVREKIAGHQRHRAK